MTFVPDIALGVVTVLVVIGGESVINDLTDRLRALKEAAEMLKLQPPATSTVTAQSGSTVNVDNTRGAQSLPYEEKWRGNP